MKPKRRTFLSRLVIAYTMVLILLLTTLFGAAYMYILRVSEQNTEIGQAQLLEKTATQVEMFYAEMNQIAEKVRVDSKLISMFANLQDDPDPANYFATNIMEAIDAQSRLRTIVGPAPSIWRVILYNENGDIVSTDHELMSGNGAAMSAGQVQALIGQLSASRDKSMAMPVSSDAWPRSGGIESLSYITLLTNYYKTEIYGVIEVQQTVAKLESYLGTGDGTGTYTAIYDSDGVRIFPAQEGAGRFAGDDVIDSGRAVSTLGLYVELTQSKSIYRSSYNSVLLYLAVALAAIMLFVFFMFYFITRSASRPLVSLTQTVRDISLSHMPTEIAPAESSDELKNLAEAFNAMIQRIRESVSVEKRSYLLALQSQMNPHFLYNSLSVVASMGLESGDENIVEFCGRLSAMLRYSTTHENQMVTLADELANTHNYLGLMKMRYETNLRYEVDVEEALLAQPIPRLTLQPIVENCFEHGFKNIRPPWEVRITASMTGQGWRLSIRDNGSGISEAQISELKTRVAEYSGDIATNFDNMRIGGLGLVNTIVRLRLVSNGNIRCTVAPIQPNGTEVLLEGNNGHTNSDR